MYFIVGIDKNVLSRIDLDHVTHVLSRKRCWVLFHRQAKWIKRSLDSWLLLLYSFLWQLKCIKTCIHVLKKLEFAKFLKPLVFYSVLLDAILPRMDLAWRCVSRFSTSLCTTGGNSGMGFWLGTLFAFDSSSNVKLSMLLARSASTGLAEGIPFECDFPLPLDSVVGSECSVAVSESFDCAKIPRISS